MTKRIVKKEDGGRWVRGVDGEGKEEERKIEEKKSICEQVISQFL